MAELPIPMAIVGAVGATAIAVDVAGANTIGCILQNSSSRLAIATTVVGLAIAIAIVAGVGSIQGIQLHPPVQSILGPVLSILGLVQSTAPLWLPPLHFPKQSMVALSTEGSPIPILLESGPVLLRLADSGPKRLLGLFGFLP